MANRYLTRWDPFRDVMAMQEDLSRLLGQVAGVADGASGQSTFALDMWETEDAYHINCDLPGVTPDQIDLTFDQSVLTIRGERRIERQIDEGALARMERRSGTFQRSLSMPSQVDADGIQASVRDGVLEIVVPKAEQAKPRRIKIGEGARELGA